MNYKFLFLSFIYFFSLNILAENPRLLIDNILDEIKKNQTLEAVIDNIDFEPYFNSIEESERSQLGFSSVNDLKAFYLAKVKAKGEDKVELIKKVSEEDKDINSEERGILNKVKSELKNQTSDFDKKLSIMFFDFESEKVEKDRAEFLITRVIGSDKKQFIVKVKLIDNSWKINSGIIFNPLALPEDSNSPIGNMPEPTQVLFNP